MFVAFKTPAIKRTLLLASTPQIKMLGFGRESTVALRQQGEDIGMFDRIISIDWSGAGKEDDGNGLRVALFADGTASVVDRQIGHRTCRRWSRAACRAWLTARLAETPRTLVAMDFGFGFPWGSDRALFGVEGWLATIHRMRALYEQQETARLTAAAINEDERFNGHGPYRFDGTRNDFRFYLDHGVGYYRLAELVAPQAISQWYLGSGGTVGFHSITGMAAIAHLVSLREQGEVDFQVWPQEGEQLNGSKHVLVESYPAICPRLDDYGPCRDNDQRDAWKVLRHLATANQSGEIAQWFTIVEQSFGRISKLGFLEQIRFEGWIIGLR